MVQETRRMRQVNRLILEELGAMLITEIQDESIRLQVTVTEVQTTKDLRQAKVYVSIRGDEREQQACLENLKSMAKHLRYLLGQRIRLKYLPELLFRVDDTQDKAERIEQILHDVLPKEEDEPL